MDFIHQKSGRIGPAYRFLDRNLFGHIRQREGGRRSNDLVDFVEKPGGRLMPASRRGGRHLCQNILCIPELIVPVIGHPHKVRGRLHTSVIGEFLAIHLLEAHGLFILFFCVTDPFLGPGMGIYSNTGHPNLEFLGIPVAALSALSSSSSARFISLTGVPCPSQPPFSRPTPGLSRP